MTFRRELFLGGFKNISVPAPKTGATSGFVGCVRRLQINNKDYDMRKGSFIGDTLYGVNVGRSQFPSKIIADLCSPIKMVDDKKNIEKEQKLN